MTKRERRRLQDAKAYLKKRAEQAQFYNNPAALQRAAVETIYLLEHVERKKSKRRSDGNGQSRF